MIEKKSDLGTRHNEGKLRWSLVDWNSLEELAKVRMFGAEKYERENWRKGFPMTELSDSLLRHVFAFMNGEDIDEESGISHLGHIMCNAMFMNYVHKNKPELDDRENKNASR